VKPKDLTPTKLFEDVEQDLGYTTPTRSPHKSTCPSPPKRVKQGNAPHSRLDWSPRDRIPEFPSMN